MANNRARGRRAESQAAETLESILGKRVHVISRPRQEDICGGDIMVDMGGQRRPIIQVKRKAGKRPKWVQDALSDDALGAIKWGRSKWIIFSEIDGSGNEGSGQE